MCRKCTFLLRKMQSKPFFTTFSTNKSSKSTRYETAPLLPCPAARAICRLRRRFAPDRMQRLEDRLPPLPPPNPTRTPTPRRPSPSPSRSAATTSRVSRSRSPRRTRRRRTTATSSRRRPSRDSPTMPCAPSSRGSRPKRRSCTPAPGSSPLRVSSPPPPSTAFWWPATTPRQASRETSR